MNAPIPIPRRRRRRWIWFLATFVLLGGLIAGVVHFSKSSQARAARSISTDELDLRVGKTEVADIQVTVNEIGTIEPVVKVDVKSTLSGKVTELLVREGEKVARGQVLARVEPDVNQAQELSAVRSELNMAEIRETDAKRELETNQRLRDEGYLSTTR